MDTCLASTEAKNRLNALLADVERTASLRRPRITDARLVPVHPVPRVRAVAKATGTQRF
jgi:hypothetical protein